MISFISAIKLKYGIGKLVVSYILTPYKEIDLENFDVINVAKLIKVDALKMT